MDERTEKTLLVLLAILALALFVLTGGDDAAELQAHAEWMQGLEDSGAWVVW